MTYREDDEDAEDEDDEMQEDDDEEEVQPKSVQRKSASRSSAKQADPTGSWDSKGSNGGKSPKTGRGYGSAHKRSPVPFGGSTMSSITGLDDSPSLSSLASPRGRTMNDSDDDDDDDDD